MIYVPQQINDFLDSDIPFIADLYSSTVTYTDSSIVRIGDYQYKSTLSSNLGNDPLTSLGVYWIKWQPANDFAMLDLSSAYSTQWNDTTGYVIIERGRKTYLGLGLFNAEDITIEYLDALDTVVYTDTFTFSKNGNVYDVWSYAYGGFVDNSNKVIFKPIYRIGKKIKITFIANGTDANCGFLVAGEGVDAGKTMNDVEFPDKLLGTKIIKTATFTTFMKDSKLMRILNDAKALEDTPLMVVIDESENSKFDNMVIIGKFTSIQGAATDEDISTISWQAEQTNYNI